MNLLAVWPWFGAKLKRIDPALSMARCDVVHEHARKTLAPVWVGASLG
jgi:hypothetical protein